MSRLRPQAINHASSWSGHVTGWVSRQFTAEVGNPHPRHDARSFVGPSL